jgi:ligand-binding SRPBCC domain-containing protein
MPVYTLKRSQKLPIDLYQAWNFFSSPENLALITPPYMGFKITGGFKKASMVKGMAINYIVKPVLNLPLKWETEIIQTRDYHSFIDVQRKGPYRLWHHIHMFKEDYNGIIMYDEIKYVVPFGCIGKIMHKLFIRKRIEDIFNYRKKKLKELFG